MKRAKKKTKRERQSVKRALPCTVCALRAKLEKMEAAGRPPPVHPGEPPLGYEVGYVHAMAAIMFYQHAADPDLSQLSTLFCQPHGKLIASQIEPRLRRTPLQPCHVCHALRDHRKTNPTGTPGALYADGLVDGIAALMVHRIQANDFDCSELRHSFCEIHSKFIALHAAPLIGWANLPPALVERVAAHIEADQQAAKDATRTQN